MSIESRLYEGQGLVSLLESLGVLAARWPDSPSRVRGCGRRGADVAPLENGIVRCRVSYALTVDVNV